MKFRTAFRMSLYLTLISATMAVATAEQQPIYILLMFAACAVHAAATARKPGFSLPGKATALMAVFAIAYLVYDIRTSEYILFSAAHFMVMLQVIKLFHLRRDRDIKELLLMSLILIGVSAVMSLEFTFAPIFVLYVFCGLVAQILFTVQRDAEAGGAEPVLTRRMAAMASLLTGLCLAGALAVFLTFPRLGPSFSPFIRPFSSTLTGFSRSVRLRGTGRLEPNPQIAFRAQLSGSSAETIAPNDLLWRGLALEHFDGNDWTATDPGKSAGQRRVQLPFNDISDPTHALIQRIELSPWSSRVMFALWEIKGASIPGKDDIVVLRDKRRGFYSVRTSLSETVSYQVRSQPPPGRAVLAAAQGTIPPRIFRANTQLPERIRERLAPLARRIAPDASCPTPLDKVEAVERHLQANYLYTTELPGEVEDPVGYFLFDKKEGHCEIFAAAMASLLRSLDLPARVVNGYKGGQWNEFLGKYIVRQNDAHSWVEVYFPTATQTQDNGSAGVWVQYDPTPLRAAQPSDGRGLVAYLSRIVDFIHIKWTDNVIYYGRSQQAGLARFFTNVLAATITWDRRSAAPAASSFAHAFNWAGHIAVPFLTVGVLAVAGRRLLRLKPHFGLNKVDRSRTKFYRELLKLLEKRGHRRLSCQTPLEFARGVVACEGAAWAGVDAVTRIFCDVRYGSHRPGAGADAQRILNSLRSIAKAKNNVRGKVCV